MRRFFDIHHGETCLIVLNGISLREVPVEFLRSHPSFGCNTIWKHEKFTPTYWAAVDDRNRIIHGEGVAERLADVPKFIPTPNLDEWEGPNFFRFKHKPAPYWERNAEELLRADLFETEGIFYSNSPQVLMQLAFWMGFRRMLIVGMDHRPYADGYFWGVDEPILDNRNDDPRFRVWEKGYRAIYAGLAAAGVEMWNLTPNSLAEAIPHGELLAVGW